MKRNAYNSLEYIKIEEDDEFNILEEETKPFDDPNLSQSNFVGNDWEAQNDRKHGMMKYDEQDQLYIEPAHKKIKTESPIVYWPVRPVVTAPTEEPVTSVTVKEFLKTKSKKVATPREKSGPKPQKTGRKNKESLPAGSRWNFKDSLLNKKSDKRSLEGDEDLYKPESLPNSMPVESIGEQVGKMLEELDREFETNYTNQSRHDWLTGRAEVRKEIIRRFQLNIHPSPQELQAMSEEMDVTYRMIFYNYDRLRINHKIECTENDNCERIKEYFKSGSSEDPHARLPSDLRALLEKEMIKFFARDLKLSPGQIHVLCDTTGIHPAVVRAYANSFRKKYLAANANPTTEEEKQIILKREFDVDPFPNPKRYQELATQLEIRYEDVQAFYNNERFRYVRKYGPYEYLEEVLPEVVSDALWELAKQGKQMNHEKRQTTAKRYKTPYISIAFWFDNYVSQLNGSMEKYNNAARPVPSTS